MPPGSVLGPLLLCMSSQSDLLLACFRFKPDAGNSHFPLQPLGSSNLTPLGRFKGTLKTHHALHRTCFLKTSPGSLLSHIHPAGVRRCYGSSLLHLVLTYYQILPPSGVCPLPPSCPMDQSSLCFLQTFPTSSYGDHFKNTLSDMSPSCSEPVARSPSSWETLEQAACLQSQHLFQECCYLTPQPLTCLSCQSQLTCCLFLEALPDL